MIKRFNCMRYKVTKENFSGLEELWRLSRNGENFLRWPTVFILPQWLQGWWNTLGKESELHLLTVKDRDVILGAAPLVKRGDTAYFAGSPEVCDYMDFIACPGQEKYFFASILQYLEEGGTTKIELHSLPGSSPTLYWLEEIAGERSLFFEKRQEAVSIGLGLPGNWEAYLSALGKKQRHEVRRKLRRMKEAGEYRFRIMEGEQGLQYLSIFMEMFKSNYTKKVFLTPPVEKFFISSVKGALQTGVMKMGLLELEGRPAAAVLLFDYQNDIFLYNSAYNPEFKGLSVGLISKLLTIKESIRLGRGFFDFLKGEEEYKCRLGGRPHSIFGCRLSLKDT